MEHTQGTWRVTGTGTIRYIDVAVGNGMVQEVATCMRTEYGDMEANARRIVACVNACAGMPQNDVEELAKFGVMELTVYADDMRQQRDELQSQLDTERASLFAESRRKQQLEQQVAELVGVLERIADTDPEDGTAWFHDVARAVIQKVRGGE